MSFVGTPTILNTQTSVTALAMKMKKVWNKMAVKVLLKGNSSHNIDPFLEYVQSKGIASRREDDGVIIEGSVETAEDLMDGFDFTEQGQYA